MKRFADWEQRLATYLAPLRDQAFAWGVNDCCTFAAGAVEAMTGEDAMPEFRGAYADEDGAKAALKATGKGTLVRTMNAKFKRVPVGHAHRGDIVMVAGNLGISMGSVSIHVGQDAAREGLIRHNRRDWQRAWSVPMAGQSHG